MEPRVTDARLDMIWTDMDSEDTRRSRETKGGMETASFDILTRLFVHEGIECEKLS